MPRQPLVPVPRPVRDREARDTGGSPRNNLVLPLLTPAERIRLYGIPGRLAPLLDRERAAAALLVNRMLREPRLTWDTAIVCPAEQPAKRRHLELTQRHREWNSPREGWFVSRLADLRHLLTPKQAAKLTEVAADLRAREFA